tara:strand:+ start:381 stop:617 length:237 start_codon:yes stop_codon:yes gene_type:complete
MIKIYGKVGCSSCTKAKALCAQGNIDYEYLELDRDFTREQMLEMFPQAKTFPQIIVEEKAIGGYEKLQEHLFAMRYTC